MSEQLTCFHCGAKLTEDTMHELDDHLMCDECFDELTTICDCCLDRIWRAEAEGNRVLTLCHYCYENNYCNCSNCGFLIHNDDAHYLDNLRMMAWYQGMDTDEIDALIAEGFTPEEVEEYLYEI